VLAWPLLILWVSFVMVEGLPGNQLNRLKTRENAGKSRVEFGS